MKAFDYPLQLNGKTYSLTYSFKARRAFENKHKRSVSGLLASLVNSETQTADDLIKFFVLMLSTNHPEIGETEAEALICELGGEDEAMRVIMAALGVQVGEADPQ